MIAMFLFLCYNIFMYIKKFSVFFLFLIASFHINAQSKRPIVTDINAVSISSARVEITWTLPEIDENNKDFKINGIYIYRATQPFSSVNQLNSIEPVAFLDAESISYTDILKNFREHFYAVICSTENGRYEIILPSINATVSGVRAKNDVSDNGKIPEKNNNVKYYFEGQKREVPLPYLEFMEDYNKTPSVFSPKALDALKSLNTGYEEKKLKILEPYFFDEDLIASESGDDFFLFDALKKTFSRKKYIESISEFDKLLSVNRNENVVKRTLFYKGEAFYYTGDFKKAINAFLSVENDYPELSRQWIEACLDQIEIK